MGRRVVLFFLALVLAIGGAGAVLAYVSKADSRAVAAQEPVTVVVVKHAIKAGTNADDAISKGYLGTEKLARRAVPSGVLTKPDAVKGQVALVDLYEGQLVAPTLFGIKAAATVGLQLPSGKMAVSVTATDAQHVGQFVQPGSYVAVFDTFTSQTGTTAPYVPSGDGLSQGYAYDQATRLLLGRVEVLAVGATTSVPPTPSPSASGATASPSAASSTQLLLTLAADQGQAQKLILASETGNLYFTLLPAAASATPGPGVDNHNLFDGR
jgi:pilus assembly protein CpaB